MARYTGPKNKRSRREGVNLTGTTSKSLARRLDVPPGGKKSTRRRQTSEYMLGLRAKQRVKREYGMMEKQFLRFYEDARSKRGSPGLNLLQLLERRLDNVVYRLGFARTRPMARQMVNHRHVRVNGKPLNIPSALVQEGDVIELTEAGLDVQDVREEMASRATFPSWLRREGAVGRITGQPQREDVPPDIREDLIVEFYAR